MKRTATVEGLVLNVGMEKAGSPIGVAGLDFGDLSGQLMAELNATQVPVYSLPGCGPAFVLRAADTRMLGKKCKLTVTIEVEP